MNYYATVKDLEEKCTGWNFPRNDGWKDDTEITIIIEEEERQAKWTTPEMSTTEPCYGDFDTILEEMKENNF